MPRRTVTRYVALTAVVLAAPVVLLGHEPPKVEPLVKPGVAIVTVPELVDAAKNPVAALVPAVPPQAPANQSAPGATDPKPRVVCGMTVIPVTAAMDPHMVKSPPADPNVTFSMRIITPPICGGAR